MHTSLQFEEYEALQLVDYKDLSHEEAAATMNISRPTFTRIYDSCRKKIAKAFAEGLSIIIEGGNVQFDKQWFRCNDCHHLFPGEVVESQVCPACGSKTIEYINQTVQGWQEINRPGGRSSPGTFKCICTVCKKEVEHIRGIPCASLKCPECGKPMVKKHGN
jgi:predicted DNA-binding protein (UPF0251 family)